MESKEQQRQNNRKEESAAPKWLSILKVSDWINVVIAVAAVSAVVISIASFVSNCNLARIQEEQRVEYNTLIRESVELSAAQYEELTIPHARHNEVNNELQRLDERIERAGEILESLRQSGNLISDDYEDNVERAEELLYLAEREWLYGDFDEAERLINQAHDTLDVLTNPPPRPDVFVSEILVTSGVVTVGETVTISVVVSNDGNEEGDYDLVLLIDDQILESEIVTISAQSRETATFTTVAETLGIHVVQVDHLSTIFAVLERSEALEEPYALNWFLIGGIIGGCAVLTAIATIFLLRRLEY